MKLIVTKKEFYEVIEAIECAVLWQESIADAHIDKRGKKIPGFKRAKNASSKFQRLQKNLKSKGIKK